MTVLSPEQKQHFIDNGYIILSDILPSSTIEHALEYCDEVYAANNADFHTNHRRHPSITSLYTGGVLETISDELLGGGNSALLCDAQIAYTQPSPSTSALKSEEQRYSKHPSQKWHIDASKGDYMQIGTDFMLLFGVALSCNQNIDENRGQLTYFPRSHYVTHTAISELIQQRSVNTAEVMTKFRTSHKPNAGQPKRALLAQGDVIVAHQRLAHCPGFNFSDETRKNVYFRVTHRAFRHLVYSFVVHPTPWTGFYGLYGLLNDETLLVHDEENEQDEVNKEKQLLSAKSIGLKEPLLSESELETFRNEGFVIVSKEAFMNMDYLIEKATARVNKVLRLNRYSRNKKRWIVGAKEGEDEGVIEIARPVRLNQDFMDVMIQSGMVDAAECLLGKQNVVIGNGIADVFQIPGTNAEEEEYQEGDNEEDGNRDEGDEMLRSASWTVSTGSGRFKGRGFDHLVQIGVTLSDGLDREENRGQLLVWPGTFIPFLPSLTQSYEKEEKNLILLTTSPLLLFV